MGTMAASVQSRLYYVRSGPGPIGARRVGDLVEKTRVSKKKSYSDRLTLIVVITLTTGSNLSGIY